MAAEPNQDIQQARIMLGILDAVERDGGQSQRRLAVELGIALGLVNSYLKRCTKKGLVKVKQVPARRYAYYLTPRGFAEKSRLTVEYLSYSFGFFREAKANCLALFQIAKSRGMKSVVLAGQSDLAEIAALCASEQAIAIVGVVQAGATTDRFIGLPVFADFEAPMPAFDAVIVTDLLASRETYAAAVARFGAARVLLPELLRVRSGAPEEVR